MPVAGCRLPARLRPHASARAGHAGKDRTGSEQSGFGLKPRGATGPRDDQQTKPCPEKPDRLNFQRYIDEFTYRYNNRSRLGVEDQERAARTVKAMDGKRLTYRRIGGQEEDATTPLA